MKKIFILLFASSILLFIFSTSEVVAKKDWKCLYGNCKKDDFVIFKDNQGFFMGNAHDRNSIHSGILKYNDSKEFLHYVKEQSLIKLTDETITFGNLGSYENGRPCIYEGYKVSLEFNDIEDYTDDNCNP